VKRSQSGDLERVLLRRGNRGSAKDWRSVLPPVIEHYRDLDIPKFLRGDSAFAVPKLLRLLKREVFRYAIRLRTNAVVERCYVGLRGTRSRPWTPNPARTGPGPRWWRAAPTSRNRSSAGCSWLRRGGGTSPGREPVFLL
jgi:hypothetical protein